MLDRLHCKCCHHAGNLPRTEEFVVQPFEVSKDLSASLVGLNFKIVLFKEAVVQPVSRAQCRRETIREIVVKFDVFFQRSEQLTKRAAVYLL